MFGKGRTFCCAQLYRRGKISSNEESKIKSSCMDTVYTAHCSRKVPPARQEWKDGKEEEHALQLSFFCCRIALITRRLSLIWSSLVILNKAVPVQCISYYLLHEILSLGHFEFVWLCKNDDLMSSEIIIIIDHWSLMKLLLWWVDVIRN